MTCLCNEMTDGWMGWINNQEGCQRGDAINRQPNVLMGKSKQADSTLKVTDGETGQQQPLFTFIKDRQTEKQCG